MKLTEIEKHHALWRKIEDELTARLAVLREKNDGNLDVSETAKLRGQIVEIKRMLDWAKIDPTVTGD